jgi:hypothetical protein
MCTAAVSSGSVQLWSWRSYRNQQDYDSLSIDQDGNNASFTFTPKSAGTNKVAVYACSDPSPSTSLSLSPSCTSTDRDLTVQQVQPPVLSDITCQPSPATQGQSVTCSAPLSSGTAGYWGWSSYRSQQDFDSLSIDQDGHGTSFTFTPRSAGTNKVQVHACADANPSSTIGPGCDSRDADLTVQGGSPTLGDINCQPSPAAQGQSVSCTASLTAGTAGYWGWATYGSQDDFNALRTESVGNGPEFSFTPKHQGTYTVQVRACFSSNPSNTTGSGCDSKNMDLTVQLQPPVLGSITCQPSSAAQGQSVTCSAQLTSGVAAYWGWASYRSQDDYNAGTVYRVGTDTSSQSFTFTPGSAGSYVVSVHACLNSSPSSTVGPNCDSTQVTLPVSGS